MKRNPFTKRIDGIGPGPADMAQARIRAMATIARQTEQEKRILQNGGELAKRELTKKLVGVQREATSDAWPESNKIDPISKSGSVERRVGFRWMRRLWAARD